MLKLLALAVALLLPLPAQAASTINSLPSVAQSPGTFPLPDPGCTATSTENFWISQGTGSQQDFKIDALRAGYIFQGATAPSCPFKFQLWWNTNTTPPSLMVYSGSVWTAVGWFDTTNNLWVASVGSGSIPNIASGATTDLCQSGTLPNGTIDVTGNATINSFGNSCPLGSRKILVWKGTPTIVASPNIIMPTGTTTTVASGDVWFVNYLGNGVWQQYFQQPGGKTFGLNINLSASLPSAARTVTLTADTVNVGTALAGANTTLVNFSQSFDTSATGAGGMDQGAAPLNNFVAIYAISGSAGISTLGIACDVSCPSIYAGTHMPTGYTSSSLLAVWPTEGTGKLSAGYLKGKRFQWGPVGAPLYGTQTPATSTQLSLLGFVPPVATSAQGQMSLVTTGAYPGGSPWMTIQSDGNAAAGLYTVQSIVPPNVAGALNNNFDILLPNQKLVWYSTSSDISAACAAYLFVYSYTIP